MASMSRPGDDPVLGVNVGSGGSSEVRECVIQPYSACPCSKNNQHGINKEGGEGHVPCKFSAPARTPLLFSMQDTTGLDAHAPLQPGRPLCAIEWRRLLTLIPPENEPACLHKWRG